MNPSLYLGFSRRLDGGGKAGPFLLPSDHLLTHGVVVGMTGSGKTGLLTVLVEEALRSSIPVMVIDVKGDLPNLLLSFPSFQPDLIAPWVELASEIPDLPLAGPRDSGLVLPTMASLELAARLAREREAGLGAFGLVEADLADFKRKSFVRVITPGSDAGELLHVLSSLERRSSRWDTDREGARTSLAATISLVLRLIGRESDSAKSREHVLLSVLAERRLVNGESAEISSLLPEILDPPIESIGALPMDAYLSRKSRADLAAALNSLLASPSFCSWREGATLEVGAWMRPVDGRTPVTIVSVAHLDDADRSLVLGMVLEETLSWVRSLPGSQRLKALIVFDEVYGYLPPAPFSPPTKRPLVALMKQARGFGVGVVVATQNPMDLDYRALSNAGLWCIGRLQTDADRVRVVDGLSHDPGAARRRRPGATEVRIGEVLKHLPPRWFVMRDGPANATGLIQPRWTMSFLRGPMTRAEIRRARAG